MHVYFIPQVISLLIYKGVVMTKDTKNSNQATPTIIKSSASMLDMEDSIELEMNKLKDELRQKALEVSISNQVSVSDNSN